MLPGKTVTIQDGGAYGMIMLQGHGTMGVWDIETPDSHPLRPAHDGRVLRDGEAPRRTAWSSPTLRGQTPSSCSSTSVPATLIWWWAEACHEEAGLRAEIREDPPGVPGSEEEAP